MREGGWLCRPLMVEGEKRLQFCLFCMCSCGKLPMAVCLALSRGTGEEYGAPGFHLWTRYLLPHPLGERGEICTRYFTPTLSFLHLLPATLYRGTLGANSQ